MSESQTNDVEQEVVIPAEETNSDHQSATQEVSSEPRPGSQEYNFREMRRALEESQREIRELKYQQSIQREPYQPPREEEDELATLRKDDFPTAAQVKRLAMQQAEELLRQREVDSQEERARSQYSDFDTVVSTENVQELMKDRDLAQTLSNSPNPYQAAYKLIKNSFSYNQKMQLAQKRASESDRIQKNLSKPVSSNAVVSKPIAEAHGFATMTEEARRQCLMEMEHYRSMVR